MYPTGDSFWVAYEQHNFGITFLEDVRPSQEPQRKTALKILKHRV